MSTTKKALFVCLGNICRSPIAEAVFNQVLKERNLSSEWTVDSAATSGFHTGSPPDHRALAVLKKHNVPYNNTAREVYDDDFEDFDYIFGMDENNIRNLKSMAANNCKAKILLLGDYDPKGERIIRDPYYDSGSAGFDRCYEQCLRSCNGFLDQLKG